MSATFGLGASKARRWSRATAKWGIPVTRTAMTSRVGAVALASAVCAAPPDTDAKLHADLSKALQVAEADDLVQINIVLRSQVGPEAIRGGAAEPDKKRRRKAIIELLQRHAAASNGGLRAFLRGEQELGNVGEDVRALWIANVVAARATPDTVRRIAARNDVALVGYDHPIGDALFPVLPVDRDLAEIVPQLPDGEPFDCGVELMRAPGVWRTFEETGSNVVIALVDTGLCMEHPDLANHIWRNGSEVAGRDGVDDDNNGYIDDINGWNFANNNDDLSDLMGHGTHVGGTLVGDGTSGTTTGMAPDAKLMILKISASLSLQSTVWEAMQYAISENAHIMNASIGWRHDWPGTMREIWRQIADNAMATGMVVVFAAGNRGNSFPPVDNVTTAGDVPDVITAGNTDCADVIYSGSSRGPTTWEFVVGYGDWPYPPGKTKPTVTAPGVDTVSTSNARGCSGYVKMTGTSMSTPHVAGVAALMLGADPQLDHFETKQILMATASDRGPVGSDNTYGARRSDAFEAVRQARNLIPGDVNWDGNVNNADLQSVLLAWGPCGSVCHADQNGDGVVDIADLLIVIENFT